MKIAILIRNYQKSGGGAERYCVELTERISKLHEVHVFAQKFDTHSQLITFHKIPKFFEKPRFINQLLFSWFTKRATTRKFDIVHSHELVSHADIYTIHVPCFRSILINLFGFKKKLRWISILLSPRKLFYLWLESKQMQQTNKRYFISVSEYLSRNISQCYPLISKISIAHPGSGNNFIKKDTYQKNNPINLKSSLSIPDNAFILLLVANDYKKKGLPTIIKSLDILKNNNLHLIVAGAGTNKKNVISNSTAHNIHYLGAVKDMSNLYSQVDLLIHPTLSDTYGMAPLEAMSAKLPVIISSMEFCGFTEHLNNTQALILDNPKDEIELSSKINFMYKNTDARNKIAQNGFKKSQTISWENTLNKTLSIYNLI